MTVKVTMANNSSDSVDFINATGTTLAQVKAYDDGSSNGHLELYTTASGTSTERVRVTSAGNVGIGTSSPSQKLSVVGTVESTSGGFKFPDGTTQTTAAISAGTTFGSVGSYAIAGASGLTASTAYAAGTTVAGSTLYYDNTGGSTYGAPLASQGYNAITIGTVVSYGLSGTWRLMCRIAQGSNTSYYPTALWLRIS